MIIADVLKKYRGRISVLDIELLLALVLESSREQIYSHPEFKLSFGQRRKFSGLVRRRISGEPLVYLTNHKEFFGLDFYVDERCLIPRPETEILVEETLKIAERFKNPRVLDLGTGSSCVAVALAKNLKNAEVVAADVSEEALAVAKINVEKHGVKVRLVKSDLLSALGGEKFELVVTNLPYLGESDYINQEVQFEPKAALYAGEKGVLLYEELFKEVKSSWLLFEFGFGQREEVEQLVGKYFPAGEFYVKKDLAGIDRVGVIESLKLKGQMSKLQLKT